MMYEQIMKKNGELGGGSLMTSKFGRLQILRDSATPPPLIISNIFPTLLIIFSGPINELFDLLICIIII